jgi:hypothetical protein
LSNAVRSNLLNKKRRIRFLKSKCGAVIIK